MLPFRVRAIEPERGIRQSAREARRAAPFSHPLGDGISSQGMKRLAGRAAWQRLRRSRPRAEILSNERLRQALAVRDWLLGEAREIRDPNVILEGLCLKLRDAGVPVDRAVSAIELRHAERAANARVWERGGRAHEDIFAHERGSDEDVYAHERGSESTGKRPLAEAHRLNEWIFSPGSPRSQRRHLRHRRAAERPPATPITSPCRSRCRTACGTASPSRRARPPAFPRGRRGAPLHHADARGAAGDPGVAPRHARGDAHVCRQRAASAYPLRRVGAARCCASAPRCSSPTCATSRRYRDDVGGGGDRSRQPVRRLHRAADRGEKNFFFISSTSRRCIVPR